MTRVTEAQYTVPVTLALDPDMRGLIDAYARTNMISVGQVIRRSLSACLTGCPSGLVEPEISVVARFQREQRRRGKRLTEAKRSRQRTSDTDE